MGSEVFSILEVVRLDYYWAYHRYPSYNFYCLGRDQPTKMKKPNKMLVATGDNVLL